jgi:hypothetical protein
MPVRAVSDDAGRFRFSARRAEFGRSDSGDPLSAAVPVAAAEGLGLGLPREGAEGGFTDREAVLQFVPDDGPLEGRVVGLEGKPIAGVTVRVRGLRAPRAGDLKPFLDALQTHKEAFDLHNGMLTGIHGIDLDALFPPVVTDAAGRFRLRGLGRERVADLLIEGPTIETRYVYALTRPAPRIEVPDHKNQDSSLLMTHYGSSFDHVAAPGKPVVGVVRDRDTGKPIAGALVRHYLLSSNAERRVAFRAVTDQDGRYRITGLPRGRGTSLYAKPPAGEPYLMMIREVEETPGLEPVTVDFPLARGVWIDVRVTDRVTGKPVPSSVEYTVFPDNPHLKGVQGLATPSGRVTWAEDGRFRLVGLPGRGLVSTWAADNHYRVAAGAEKIKGLDRAVVYLTPHTVIPRQAHGLAEVNVPEGAESISAEVVLDPGRTLAGTVLGPDAKPLAGVVANGLDESMHWYTRWTPAPLKTAEFTVTGLDGTRPRLVQFAHLEKGLAGFLLLKGDEKGPLTITLGPAGMLVGRVLTREGRPAVGGYVESINTDWYTADRVIPNPPDFGSFPRIRWTDAEGNFRVEGLAPGLKYDLFYHSGSFVQRIGPPAAETVAVKPGEVRDLGDLKVR